MKPLLTTGTIAKRLGLDIKTVLRWCEEGIIPGAFRPHARGRWFVHRDVFEAWIKEKRDRLAPKRTA